MPILTGFSAFDDFSSRKYVNGTLLCLCIDRLMSEIDSSIYAAKRKRDNNIVLKIFRCSHRPSKSFNCHWIATITLSVYISFFFRKKTFNSDKTLKRLAFVDFLICLIYSMR